MLMGVVAMSEPSPPLTCSERMVYEALCEAAQNGEVCPLNLDLEMIIGCNSGSTTPTIVARLERKGLIRVKRYQRFREVQIVATGEWTARSPSMHVDRVHVPRGARKLEGTPIMADGARYTINSRRRSAKVSTAKGGETRGN